MCQSLKFLMEKLIKERHLRRYIREPDHEVESGQAVDRIVADLTIPTESRPAISYILGGPSDDQYQLKSKQKKLLRSATIKVRVNAIHVEGKH